MPKHYSLHRPSWKWLVLGAIILAVASIFWWRSSINSKKNIKTFEAPQQRTIEQVLEVSGKVDAREKASLKFLAGGKITYVGAKIGDQVKKWQTIASIDKNDLQKNLTKYLNTYSIERSTIDQNLYTRKDIAGNKSIDALNAQDQFTLNNTVLDVELKNIALKNASLYAPFAGVLVSAPTEIAGTIVSASDEFLVVNPSSMTFLADVDEADISKIKEGMTATIKLDAYPQVEIPVNVHRIAYQSSEASTGTVFGVEFELPAQYQNIQYRLGMNGNVKILIDRKESVISVPVRAIIERDGKNYVDVAVTGDRSGKIVQKQVQLGLEDENYVEIQSGLQVSDRVLVR